MTMTPSHASRFQRAFSLLEMSIVVGIIGLVVAMGITSTKTMVESARIVGTKEKMKVIDEAIKAFWVKNGRLPCPANPNSAYTAGLEETGANCAGYTKLRSQQYQWATEGIIAFGTLGLPSSYAKDEWGRSFTYAVYPGLANSGAALKHPEYDRCRFLELAPYSPTQNPAYVLISHGEEGFGGVYKLATKKLFSGATAVDELNAHTDSTTFAATPYYGDYSTTYAEPEGDDIISFQTLQQLNEGMPNQQGLAQNRSILFFSSSATPYRHHYAWDGDGFIKQTNFTSTPGAALQGKIAASADHFNCHRHLFYARGAGTSFANCLYRKYDGSYLETNCTPSTYTIGATNQFYASAFHQNPTSTQMGEAVFGYATSPYLHFSQVGNDTVSGIHSTVSTSATTTDPYKPDTPPGGAVASVEYSQISGHLAVAHAGGDFLTLYNRATPTGFARVKMTAPSTLPTGAASDVAYSLDGNYLAVSHATSPYVTIYEINGTSYSKIADPADLPTGDAKAVAFSADSQFMAVAHATAPYITVYKIDTATDTFTKLDDPVTLPSGTANDIDFAAVGDKFAVAVAATAGNPPLLIYDIQHGALINDATNIDTPPTVGTTGYAVEFADGVPTVTQASAITGGLVGWWKFEEGTGTTAADTTANANTGTLNGPPTWSNDIPNALGSTGSLEFDGSSGTITVPGFVPDTIIGDGNPVSIAYWVNPTDIAQQMHVGTSSDTGNRFYSEQFARAGAIYAHWGFGNSQNSTTSTAELTAGEWNHVVITYDGTNATSYLNGTQMDTQAIGTAKNFSNGGLTIGVFAASSLYFDGNIDDVRIYNRVLSPEEIAKIAAGEG